ncbi:cell division-specific peptidoglycan biosynthesis regulator FtsW [Cryptosporangium aurantiacum]|uniref:Probable peptidoglycan glycosyltransferase FtsW n=1 Tax=Cryptosporangium aurantiacum TaxID=134849 RepID=A0A1M7I4N6_9ACTN|nr:cell division-specific peptidoglycan biosynthesis regulator FtsW [Cryptosporangium aurantiacum]
MAAPAGVETHVRYVGAVTGLLRRPMASYYALLASTGLLLGLGLIMVLSASSIDSYANSGSAFTVFTKQLTFALIGIPAFWLALRLPMRVWPLLGWPLVVLATILLMLLPFLGKEVNGATLWLDFGFIQIQPVEVAKLALVLWGAAVLVRKRPLLTEWRHLAVPLLAGSVVLFGLVGLEDFGGMILLLFILIALLWTAGVRFRVFATLGAIGVVGLVPLIAGNPERISRLTTFTDPFAHQDDDAYQLVRGFYSLGSGGWWGLGLGQSREKWGNLPEAHNDFIFAVIGEELGVLGCLVVVGLFAVLTWAGMRIASRVDDPFRRLVASAGTVWLAGQALVNMGGVVGLLPITGVPLPLISAGGSSLVLTMFVIGMLASFARHEPEAVLALHARGRAWWVRWAGIPLPELPGRPGRARQALRSGRTGRPLGRSTHHRARTGGRR